MKELIRKLYQIQNELKAPKNQRNNFGGYNYRSCEDILEAVKPLLLKYELAITISDEIIEVGGRVYVKATAKITDGDSEIINTAFAREAESKKGMDESQITGATSSYARKYALNGLLCIDDTKDADATNMHGKDEMTPAEKAKATREENKIKAEELKEKAKKTLEWIKTLKRDLTVEEDGKTQWLLKELCASKDAECEAIGNEIAKHLMDKDKIGF